jgi:hypothetical protein
MPTMMTMAVAECNTARALTRWQCLVASCEDTVALHQVMLIALYRPVGMVIEIAIELVTFVNIIDKSAARKKCFSYIFTV